MSTFSFLLGLVIIFSSFRVVSCRNAVHSVLYLILSFFCSSVLLLVTGVEVISLMLLVVYVGAVAILFLFVVMMLNLEELEKNVGFSIAKWLGLLSIVFFALFFLVKSYEDGVLERSYVSIRDLGAVLYTDYIYLFHLSGVLLLCAMIVAVSAVLRGKRDVKRQVVKDQISRSSEIRLLNVRSGEGVDYK